MSEKEIPVKMANYDQLVINIMKMSYDIVLLQNQLQAYKDKEDKLREYCQQFEYQGEYTELGRYFACRDILQILNEGE